MPALPGKAALSKQETQKKEDAHAGVL